jgi:hypothetical protein
LFGVNFFKEVGYADYDSRNGFSSLASNSKRDTYRQDVLVGRGEVWTLSQAGKTIEALHGMEGRGHSRSD